MSNERVPRREALRHLAIFSAAALLPASLLACSKSTSCLDVTGLSSDDVAKRNITNAYVDVSTDPSKECDRCAQYVAGKPDSCGSCKVLPGPINPKGGCKLFVAKPT